MNIAFLTPEFVTEEAKGGQATYLANVSETFARHGHKVYVITISDRTEDFLWKKNIYVCRIKYENELKTVSKIPLIGGIIQSLWSCVGISYLLNKKVKKLYKKGRIDIVQCSSLRLTPFFLSRNMPNVIRLSDYQPHCRHGFQEQFDVENAGKGLNLIERADFFSLQKANLIFGPSDVGAKAVEQRIHRSVHVIESPYSISLAQPTFASMPFSLKGRQYCLFFGTLNHLKGIGVVASVLDDFLEKFPEMYFVFMGADAMVPCQGEKISASEYILQRVSLHKDRIIFLGVIYDQEEKNTVITGAKFCVMPSRIDNLPNTCIEAMALKQVVIGTIGASFEQLITDGYSGFLIERENSEQLLHAMSKAMALDEKAKTEMGERAAERIKLMDPEIIYKKLLHCYMRVLKSK